MKRVLGSILFFIALKAVVAQDTYITMPVCPDQWYTYKNVYCGLHTIQFRYSTFGAKELEIYADSIKVKWHEAIDGQHLYYSREASDACDAFFQNQTIIYTMETRSIITLQDDSFIRVKNIDQSVATSLGVCSTEEYDLECTPIAEEVGGSKAHLKYYWYYNNGDKLGNGEDLWIKLGESPENKLNSVSFASLGLEPANKIKFKVEAWSVCESNKKIIDPGILIDLKYCFDDYNLEASLTPPTCYGYKDAVITLKNIPPPDVCVTYDPLSPSHKIYSFTISKYELGSLIDGADDVDDPNNYTCSGGLAAIGFKDAVGGYCLSGTSINYPFAYQPDPIVLTEKDLCITNQQAPFNQICGIGEGLYEIQIEHPLFSPYKYQTNNVQAPPLVSFTSAFPNSYPKLTPEFNISIPGGEDTIFFQISGGNPGGYKYEVYNTSNNSLLDSNTAGIKGSEYYSPGIPEGNYYVRIKDTKGCKSMPDSINVELNDPEELSISNLSGLKTKCNQNDGNYMPNGLVSFKVAGGINAYAGELRYLDNIPYKTITFSGADAIADNVAPGEYKIFIKDNGGINPYQQNTFAQTVIVGQPNALGFTSSNAIAPSCIGGRNGKIHIEATGDNAPYINFLNGKEIVGNIASADFGGLFSGKQILTIKNTLGCTLNGETIPIPDNSPIVNISSAIPQKVECYGDSTGEIEVQLANGYNSFYEVYLFEGSDFDMGKLKGKLQGSNVTFTGLGQGNYSVFVQDGYHCFDSLLTDKNSYRKLVNLAENNKILIDTIISPVIKKGDKTGIINADLSEGAGKYEYALTFDGKTSAIQKTSKNIPIDTLKAGTYELLVRDTCGCTNIIGNEWWVHQIIIREPEFPLSLLTDNLTHLKCFGIPTGEIRVHATGGWDKSYRYNLYNSDNSPKELNNTDGHFTILPAGTYIIEVVDDKGGSFSKTETLIEQPLLALSSAIPTKILCFGGSTGTIDLNLSGGTEPYYYSLDNSSWAEGTHITGLAVGTTGLSKNYLVYYKDANGCSGDVPVTLEQFPKIAIDNILKTTAQTGVNNGALEAEIKGGNPGYTYNWNNGAGGSYTGKKITNLFAGDYNLTITDINGCTKDTSAVTLENLYGPELNNISYKKPTCFGWNDGEISFDPIKGNPQYSISLNKEALPYGSITNADSAISQTFNTLYAGNYTLEITDSWGWARNPNEPYPIVLEAVDPISFNHNITHITKTGDTDGKIHFEISGGNGKYEYLLYDSLNATTIQTNKIDGIDSVLNLTKGFYTLFYRDTCGCTNDLGDWVILDDIEIIEPDPLSFTAVTIKQPDCHGDSNGSIEVSGIGGWRPNDGYSYRIDAGDWSEDSTFYGLTVGSYYIEIRDEKNVIYGDFVAVTEPDTFQLASPLDIAHASCFGYNNGSIAINLQGGTMPYIVNEDTIYTTQTILQDLTKGDYTINLKDIRGCSIDEFIETITQPSQMLDSFKIVEAQDTLSNGAIFAYIKGSVPPYNYVWEDGAGNPLSTTDSIVNYPTGVYYITVTDQHNCYIHDSIPLPQKGGPKTKSIKLRNSTCKLYDNGEVDFELFEGHPPYDLWFINTSNDTIASFASIPDSTWYSIQGLEPGAYTISIKDSWGWLSKEFYTLYEPAQIQITKKLRDVLITGQNTGIAEFTVTGGNSVYDYIFKKYPADETISQGQTSGNILSNNLYSGIYSLYLKDTAGCTNGQPNWLLMDNIAIAQPEPLHLLKIQIKNPTCYGDSNGGIRVQGMGGKPAYTYSIDNGSFTSNSIFKGLAAGTYYIQVKDAAGAIYGQNYTINEPKVLKFDVSLSNALCDANSKPSATLNISGGTQPYYHSTTNIIWYKGSIIENLTGTDYTIYVRDENGCTASPKTIHIEKAEPLKAIFTIQEAQYGLANGHIEAFVSGGKPPYNINWYGPDSRHLSTQAILKNRGTGSYHFELIDQDSCSLSQTVVLGATYGPRLASVITKPVSCLGKSDGEVSFCIKDGNGKYNAQVYKGGTLIKSFSTVSKIDSCKISGLTAGAYTIQMQDSLLWEGTASFSIGYPGLMQISPLSINMPSCFGYADGSISIAASGGNGGFSYLWDNAATGGAITNLKAGSYNVTAIDGKGCIAEAGFELTNPAALVIDLGADKTICEGQILSLSPGVFKNYSWRLNGNSISNAAQIEVYQQGQYSVLVESSKGCFAKDTFNLSVSNNILKAEFLMPSEAFENDTVVIIDVTWPVPENAKWVFDSRIKRLSSKPYVEEIAFKEPGVYDVKLITTMASCIDSISKQITVKELEGGKPEIGLGADEPLVKMFNVYPNPTTGQFVAEIELSEIAGIELRVYSMQQNSFKLIEKYYNADKYLIEYDLPTARPGVYLVVLNVKGQAKTRRVLITK